MSSSEDEADYEAMRDIVNCDFIQNCYTGSLFNTTEEVKTKSRSKNEDREDGFQKHVAKKLAARIESLIEEYEVSPTSDMITKCKEPLKKKKSGVRLFSDSVDFLKVDTKPEPVKQERPISKEVNYKGAKKRAVSVAVSPDWVLNQKGTEYWTEFKKPKVISARVVKKLDGGRLECVIE